MKLYKQKSSNIDNRGLFASKNIKKGPKIIYYTGKIITKRQTEDIQNSIMIKRFIFLT